MPSGARRADVLRSAVRRSAAPLLLLRRSGLVQGWRCRRSVRRRSERTTTRWQQVCRWWRMVEPTSQASQGVTGSGDDGSERRARWAARRRGVAARWSRRSPATWLTRCMHSAAKSGDAQRSGRAAAANCQHAKSGEAAKKHGLVARRRKHPGLVARRRGARSRPKRRGRGGSCAWTATLMNLERRHRRVAGLSTLMLRRLQRLLARGRGTCQIRRQRTRFEPAFPWTASG